MASLFSCSLGTGVLSGYLRLYGMHIYIINHYIVTPDKGGATRHYQIARMLVGFGHRVTLVASSYNHWSRKEEHLSSKKTWKKEMCSGIECVWLKTPAYSNILGRLWNMVIFALRVRFGSWRRGLEKKADIIWGSSPHLFAAYAAKKLADNVNVPYVLEIRDIWPQTLVELSGVSKKNPVILLMKKMEVFLYQKSDLIITLLPGAATYLEQNGGNREKIVWIPNCVDFALVPDISKPEKQPCFKVIYAGTVGYANGLEMIVEAAEKLSMQNIPVCFEIIGDGPEKKKLKKMIDDRGISTVLLLDPVPKADIFNKLDQADACILILKDSPVFLRGISPNKLFDYMAAGRPIIFAVNTPFNQVLEADCGLSVHPLSSESLSDTVKNLMKIPAAERWEMGKRGREYVELHNDLHTNSRKIINRLLKLSGK